MTNQLSHANLFSDLGNVTLRRVVKTDQGWIMEAHGQSSAVCPGCQSISRSRHSWYWRSLKDLPVQGTQVILRLHLGRWRCRNDGCERRIFTERLSKVCAPYAQQTKRTGEIIAAVGYALGGRPGQRLMSRLGMPVSADTLIRQVKRAAHLPTLPKIRVLGVDDWAYSRRFGSSATKVATRDSPNSFRRCVSQRQRPAGGSPRSPPHRNLNQQSRRDQDNCRRRWAAALLSKVRVELTSQQAQIVDTLKRQCPGFAVMRKLVFSFRAILRGGKVTTLHPWMENARKTGIHSLVRFVRTLKQDLSAVEAAVSEPWSNGPVEGQLNRLKMLKRQMYGRAGIELLRARLLPEPALSGP
jgi:transposase